MVSLHITELRQFLQWRQYKANRYFSSYSAARLILRSLLRGHTLRGLTAQNNPHKYFRNTGGTLQRFQLCSVRRFGHRAVRSQMPQTCASRAIWPPTASPVAESPYWADLTFVHLGWVLQCCEVLCRVIFQGQSLQGLTPEKTRKIRRAVQILKCMMILKLLETTWLWQKYQITLPSFGSVCIFWVPGG